MAAHQAPLSLGFSSQEHWSGLPFPSPVHESEKWKWSRSVMSNSLWPHGLQPTRLLCPWDFPGKSTGVGCHHLLWLNTLDHVKYHWTVLNTCIVLNIQIHCVYVPQLSYPFICWWTSRLLPCPGYYKQCCDEQWGTRVVLMGTQIVLSSNSYHPISLDVF